jgi:hypothetical protein
MAARKWMPPYILETAASRAASMNDANERACIPLVAVVRSVKARGPNRSVRTWAAAADWTG